MREIRVDRITEAVRNLAIAACTQLGEAEIRALEHAVEIEVSPIGKETLKIRIENARIAKEEKIPICQATGLAVVFIENDVHGGDLYQEGVALYAR